MPNINQKQKAHNIQDSGQTAQSSDGDITQEQNARGDIQNSPQIASSGSPVMSYSPTPQPTATPRPHPSPSTGPFEFDVFLCHNSADKPIVKQIGEQLKARGIKPWLDEWELRPGTLWQTVLEQQIAQIKAAAVFVGENGLGPWQNLEQQAFLHEFVRRECPVIPVLLPNAPQQPQLPIFLRSFMWVDLRQASPDPLAQLIWGICGHPNT